MLGRRMKKTTLYWILGLGGAAIVGGGVYLATRGPSMPQLGGGGGGGLPPPTSNQQHTAPAPPADLKTSPQAQQNFLQDASNFVNTMKSVYGVSVAGINTVMALYNGLVNVIATNFQISLPSLVPANFGLTNWPWA